MVRAVGTRTRLAQMIMLVGLLTLVPMLLYHPSSMAASKNLTDRENIYSVAIRTGEDDYEIVETQGSTTVNKMDTMELSRPEISRIRPKQPPGVPNITLSKEMPSPGKPWGRETASQPELLYDLGIMKFKPITNKSVAFVYSAHFDSRKDRPQILLVGLGPMSDDVHFLDGTLCDVSLSAELADIRVPLKVHFRISTFIPWEGQCYDSYLFTCDIGLRLDSPPKQITIANNELSLSPVFNIQAGTVRKFKFAVCIEPLVHGFDDSQAIKEFVANNMALGAEHFYFYNTTGGDKVKDILRTLEKRGLATVYQWPLGNLESQTHSAAQKAANAHCHNQRREEASYLVYIDLDEVLVPRENNSWAEVISTINSVNPYAGAYVFQSKLFPRGQTPDPTAGSFAVKHGIHSLTNYMATEPYPLYQWSKVIIDTQRVDVMDIHKVRTMIPPYQVVNVDPVLASIHHHRRTDDQYDDLGMDKTANRFVNSIIDYYTKLFIN